MNVAERTEERSLAEKTLEQLRQDKDRLEKLLKQKELDYENLLQKVKSKLSTNPGGTYGTAKKLEQLESEIEELIIRLGKKERLGEQSQGISEEGELTGFSEVGSKSSAEQGGNESFFGIVFSRMIFGGIGGMIFALILGAPWGKIEKSAVIGIGFGGAILGMFFGIAKYFEMKKSK